MNPTLTIIRGLPGSGKSQLGRKLAAKTGAILIEPDMLLIRAGVYCYEQRFFDTACDISLDLLATIGETGADAVYADVLATRGYVKDVIAAYRKGNYRAFLYGVSGFSVIVHDMPMLTIEQSIERNKHNVRREDIERMAADWESWTEFQNHR